MAKEAAKDPPPVLTPAPLPSLLVTPGAVAPTGQVALRCPGCNRLVMCAESYVNANQGTVVACPLCSAPCTVP